MAATPNDGAQMTAPKWRRAQNTARLTHLLKKVIQAVQLGRIDSSRGTICLLMSQSVTATTLLELSQVQSAVAVQYNSLADQNTHSDLKNGYIKVYAAIGRHIVYTTKRDSLNNLL